MHWSFLNFCSSISFTAPTAKNVKEKHTPRHFRESMGHTKRSKFELFRIANWDMNNSIKINSKKWRCGLRMFTAGFLCQTIWNRLAYGKKRHQNDAECAAIQSVTMLSSLKLSLYVVPYRRALSWKSNLHCYAFWKYF